MQRLVPGAASADQADLSGARAVGARDHDDVVIEPDRGAAIELAISRAHEGDVVLIAGKGHEDYQIVGTEKRPFDDRAEAQRALRELVR